MKMAAAEALWESEDPASFSLFTIGDERTEHRCLCDPHPARAEPAGLQPA